MSPARSSSSFLRRRLPAGLALLLAAAWLLTGTGCLSFKREAPRPGLTTFGTPLVVLPAATLGNYLVIEAKWDRYGPYRFLIDTFTSSLPLPLQYNINIFITLLISFLVNSP